MYKDKKTMTFLVGIVGVLFFLAGIFGVIDFTTGVLIAVILLIIAGFLGGCCKKLTKEPTKKKK
jgi:uncharacterized membrane protein